MVVGDAAWWTWADRRLRRTRHPMLWRPLIGLFSAVQLGYLVWLIAFPREGRHAHAWMPIFALAAIYVWHLLVLPAALVAILAGRIFGSISALSRRLLRSRVFSTGQLESSAAADRRDPLGQIDPSIGGITRRQALAAAAVAVPPLVLGGAVTGAMRQIHHFRIREVELPLAQLPRELHGITLAQVSDIHIGRFTRAGMLPAIADATNALRADLVLLTGDLIDLTMSDLPAGLDFVRRLDPRFGLYMIEGNHDLIEDPRGFEATVRRSGIPLLLDESATVRVRGCELQLLGLTWSHGDAAIAASIARILPQRRADLFQILLAHHPHAFDPAAAAGIPLTLSGHTHGGQIMLNERLGAGPAMFRYWSGLYEKRDGAQKLFVSNGVGNWFPLRFNAPAEIVKFTLRSKSG